MIDFLKTWKQVNATSLDLLKCIPEETYHTKPFSPRFRSFSWEFACLLTTRKMYLLGIKQGKLNSQTECQNDDEISKLSKKEMLRSLEETGTEILRMISDPKIKEIEYFGEKSSKLNVISWLFQHEQLHFGKLIIYLAQAEIEIPDSLRKMWGTQSFT